jgi:hypothetical protein
MLLIVIITFFIKFVEIAGKEFLLATANCSVQQELKRRYRKSFAGKGSRNRKCYL